MRLKIDEPGFAEPSVESVFGCARLDHDFVVQQAELVMAGTLKVRHFREGVIFVSRREQGGVRNFWHVGFRHPDDHGQIEDPPFVTVDDNTGQARLNRLV